MGTDVVKALILLARVCGEQASCEKCPIKSFCGKQFQNW